MGIERALMRASVGIALLLGATPGVAAPPEPLIVTQLRDPDPDYVRSTEGKIKPTRISSIDTENPTLDQAMREFGKAIGQAALIEQQAMQARCNSAIPAQLPAEQRFAWQANCAYRRH